MEDKNKKIAVVALIFALLALTQAQAITNATMTLIAGTGINITQSGDNYTISATGNITALPDNTKVNKSGDTMTGDLNMGFNDLTDVNSISSDFGEYNPYLGIDFLPDSISINHGLHGEKTTFLSNGVINDNSLIPSKYVCTDSNQNITSCDLPADNDSQYINKSGNETLTGWLNIQGMKIGDFQNYSTQGFSFSGKAYNSSVTAYNDSTVMYIATNSNAYFEGVAVYPTIGWHKNDKSKGSWIVQQAIGANNQIDTFYSAPTTEDPFWNFESISSQSNKTMTYSTNLTVSPLTGTANKNNVVIADSTGKLTRNTTAGAGIPIISPDGNAHCIRVSNLNVISSTTGAC